LPLGRYLIIGMDCYLLQLAGLPKSLMAAGIGHVVINLPLFRHHLQPDGRASGQYRRAARDLGAKWQVLTLITAPSVAALSSSSCR
jgi:spermidine/putrescine transport system permease protein